MDDATQRALREFVSRCRRLPPLANRKAGLDALFAGPAGTGKHQAVRTLADKRTPGANGRSPLASTAWVVDSRFR